MHFSKKFPFFSHKNQPVVITFTGGMGAQVISASIYFQMKSEGGSVYADFNYFDEKLSVAREGAIGQVSHWDWQLGIFDLKPEDFDINPNLNKKNAQYIIDGTKKLELGLAALSNKKIREYFKLPLDSFGEFKNWSDSEFLCVHVRRGDYVNVASHLVHDDEFLFIIKKFSKILRHIVVLSDSPIDNEFQSTIQKLFPKSEFLYGASVNMAHTIMRLARVLICSNSQFSLIAATLNTEALVLIPSQWYGGDDRQIEEPLHARCNFQIFENIKPI